LYGFKLCSGSASEPGFSLKDALSWGFPNPQKPTYIFLFLIFFQFFTFSAFWSYFSYFRVMTIFAIIKFIFWDSLQDIFDHHTKCGDKVWQVSNKYTTCAPAGWWKCMASFNAISKYATSDPTCHWLCCKMACSNVSVLQNKHVPHWSQPAYTGVIRTCNVMTDDVAIVYVYVTKYTAIHCKEQVRACPPD